MTDVRIAVLGDRNLDYVTHRELDATLARFPRWADAAWLATDADVDAALDAVDGVWVVPGSALIATTTPCTPPSLGAREEGLPLLGTCGGFQFAVVELARSLAGIDARHAETDPNADALVVAPLACSLVGEQRTVTCVRARASPPSAASSPLSAFTGAATGWLRTSSRRCAAGVVVSARAPDAGVEGIELASHPFFLATLFQPQVGALAGAPLHPLIGAFLDAVRAPVAR